MPRRISNRVVLVLSLIVSLLLIVWGVWNLIFSYPDYNAMNVVGGGIYLPLPSATIPR